jgi:hypothetical protein
VAEGEGPEFKPQHCKKKKKKVQHEAVKVLEDNVCDIAFGCFFI